MLISLHSYRFYYQYAPKQVSTCPVTVHTLLHIADSIEATGPVWASWVFPMERFCGALQPAIASWQFPWSSINHRLLDQAQLSQIRLLYDMPELSLHRLTRGCDDDPDILSCLEVSKSGCMHSHPLQHIFPITHGPHL